MEGGSVERCGWAEGVLRPVLADRAGGARRQMKHGDRARARWVAKAMLNMAKLDVDGLSNAYNGSPLSTTSP